MAQLCIYNTSNHVTFREICASLTWEKEGTRFKHVQGATSPVTLDCLLSRKNRLIPLNAVYYFPQIGQILIDSNYVFKHSYLLQYM